MNVELKDLSNASKVKQAELQNQILKLKQDFLEQTNITEHYEKRLQT